MFACFLIFQVKEMIMKYVPLKETIRGFKAIIDGEMDEYPENAFFNVGTIEDVKKAAERMKEES